MTTLADITKRTTEWLRGIGPMHDVVISSRVRLARNIAGAPFLPRCNPNQQVELLHSLRDKFLPAGLARDMFFVDIALASELDRQLLVERHLISRQHAEDDHPRGVIISGDETISLMINEEDHIRLQVLRSGMQLHEAFNEITRIDNLLEEQVDFAFSEKLGYLTACPTNVGTGLRVSVMLHLPALRLTKEIEKAFRAARDMKLAVRGLYGEGTEAMGDFFQISNQITLGKSEEQIVQEFLAIVVPEILNYERQARAALLKTSKLEVDDKVFRSLALLRSARKISSQETMARLSMVRLGVNLERIKDVDLKTINELFLLCQPAHLQKIHGKEMSPDQRAELRATMVGQRL